MRSDSKVFTEHCQRGCGWVITLVWTDRADVWPRETEELALRAKQSHDEKWCKLRGTDGTETETKA